MNKALRNITIAKDYKVYLNNYIKESMMLMRERGYVDEFICYNNNIINYLELNNIIEKAVYHDGILLPLKCCNSSKNPVYIISDSVLELNGFTITGVKQIE